MVGARASQVVGALRKSWSLGGEALRCALSAATEHQRSAQGPSGPLRANSWSLRCGSRACRVRRHSQALGRSKTV